MKILYYVFLTLSIIFVLNIFLDGCESQRRIQYGAQRPEDTYLSVGEFNDILYAVVLGILAIICRILWDKEKKRKEKRATNSNVNSNQNKIV